MKGILKLFFKKDMVILKVYSYGADTYYAMAYDGKFGVYNCYGTTPEKAKEMAIFKLKMCYQNENVHEYSFERLDK